MNQKATRRRRGMVPRACGVALVICLAGCGNQPDTPSAGGEPAVDGRPAPAFETVVAGYNQRTQRLERLRAQAVVRLTYADERGDRHTDQGEGILQMVRPDRVALSIKKAGKMLFWLGCDAERYWFFDVVDEKIARVGRNPRENELIAGDAAGIGIPPRELFELIGMNPLDAADTGTVGWTKDGRELIVSIPRSGARGAVAGETVLWMNPTSYEPSRVERRDAQGRVIVGATLSGYEGVELTGVGGLKPRLATRLDAVYAPSDTRIRLDLSEMRDGEIRDAAFTFETLRQSLGVDTVIDVDAEARPAPPRASPDRPRDARPSTPADRPAAPSPAKPVPGKPLTPAKKPMGTP